MRNHIVKSASLGWIVLDGAVRRKAYIHTLKQQNYFFQQKTAIPIRIMTDGNRFFMSHNLPYLINLLHVPNKLE